MFSWIGSVFSRKPDNEDGPRTRYGWVRDLPDFRDHCKTFQEFSGTPSVDLRQKCPDVYNQGPLGSCTANAIAGAYEFDMMAQEEKAIFTPSRLFIYYNERAMEGTIPTDSGAQIRDGIKSIGKQGVVPESEWPYDISAFTTEPSPALYTEAKNHTAVKYSRVAQDIKHIKQALVDGHPIVFGFSVYESFESEEVAKTGIMPMPEKSEQLLGGHAVMAVGYDDEQGRVIVRNSWGDSWGDKGCFYMPYEFISDSGMASDFWIVQKVIDQDLGSSADVPQPFNPEK